MWKIFITYDDKSKVTLTGKHKDIPLRLAWKYYMQYVNGRMHINHTRKSMSRRLKHGTGGRTMRLIDADELIKDRVENDPVRIAAECAPTAFDKEKVIEEIRNVPYGYYNVETENEIVEIVEKGGVE